MTRYAVAVRARYSNNVQILARVVIPYHAHSPEAASALAQRRASKSVFLSLLMVLALARALPIARQGACALLTPATGMSVSKLPANALVGSHHVVPATPLHA